MPDVDKLFLDELARRGITPTRDAEGTVVATVNGLPLRFSLDNLRLAGLVAGVVERFGGVVLKKFVEGGYTVST